MQEPRLSKSAATPRIGGWEDADMARVYTRKAAQKRLAASGAAKLGYREAIVPLTVPPSKLVNKNNNIKAGWWTRQGSNL